MNLEVKIKINKRKLILFELENAGRIPAIDIIEEINNLVYKQFNVIPKINNI